MKILHFAIENYAGVPAQLVQAERELGHHSVLMTLYPSPRGVHDEDYCLNMPFVGTRSVTLIKKYFNPFQSQPGFYRRDPSVGTPVWQPKLHEKILFGARDKIWESAIRSRLEEIEISSFDLLVLDGGAGFLRNGKIVRELKQQGMQIAVLYCGSDLRTRGRIPAVDDLADHRFTVEFDHTILYPDLEFLFFPFMLSAEMGSGDLTQSQTVRIGHSPTKRKIKGTDIILEQLKDLQKEYTVEIVLIENLPYPEALRLKKSCDLFVEAIGELGYGISGLEALAMGIPSAVELMPDFENFLGDHPFINISRSNICESLIPYIESEDKRNRLGKKGKQWVYEHHHPVRVASKMLSFIING